MRVLPESASENPLKKYFRHNTGHTIHKWHHYFDIYHNHFVRFRNKPVRVLEIGVFHGGSLQMWKHYFGPEAVIYGLDINPECKQLEEQQIHIIIADQNDSARLQQIAEQHGPFDIIIDDGGHTMEQQTLTFDTLFPHVDPHGVYLVEDLHTSYWPEYQGGYRRPGTFIEKAKGLIDSLNAWHSRTPEFVPDNVTSTTTGIHIYDSVIVLEKCPNPSPPQVSKTGHNPYEATP